jgi:YHS domain-containing protein
MCEAHNHDAAPVHEHSHSEAAPAEGHCHTHSVATADDSTAECPVMRGNYVDTTDAEASGLVRDYDGTRYYLCCAACGPLFDADPEKYLVAL